MRRAIGWIVILLIAFGTLIFMTFWGLRNEGIYDVSATLGNLVIAGLVGGLFAWFIFPLLDKEE